MADAIVHFRMMNPFTLSSVYSVRMLVCLYVHRFLDLSHCRLQIKNNETLILLQFRLKTLIVTYVHEIAQASSGSAFLPRKTLP